MKKKSMTVTDHNFESSIKTGIDIDVTVADSPGGLEINVSGLVRVSWAHNTASLSQYIDELVDRIRRATDAGLLAVKPGMMPASD